MSAASSFDVPCGSCGAMNQALNAFCGMCGDSIKSANGIEQPRGERDHRYRGPRRLLILATTAIAIGAPAAIASFSAVQGKGVSGFALDVAVPAVNLGLQIAGITQISTPVGSEGASVLLVAAFIGGFVLSALGGWLFLFGAIWMLARYWSRARPATSQGMPEGKHQVAAAVARSQQEIASMRPKVARAVDIGREAVEHDVLPRVSAQTRRGKLKAMSLITRSAAAARTRLARRRLKQESGK